MYKLNLLTPSHALLPQPGDTKPPIPPGGACPGQGDQHAAGGEQPLQADDLHAVLRDC